MDSAAHHWVCIMISRNEGEPCNYEDVHSTGDNGRTESHERRGCCETFTTDGTGKNETGALYTMPDAWSRTTQTTTPRSSDAGDANNEPISDC